MSEAAETQDPPVIAVPRAEPPPAPVIEPNPIGYGLSEIAEALRYLANSVNSNRSLVLNPWVQDDLACKKCGSEDIKVKYCSGRSWLRFWRKPKKKAAYLKIRCGRCAFRWTARCKDNPDPESLPFWMRPNYDNGMDSMVAMMATAKSVYAPDEEEGVVPSYIYDQKEEPEVRYAKPDEDE
jgi:hypothetical protein